jgi:glyoxylase-like metal-dependent hydrolase (beta-lactamase superfamily II)
VPTLHDLQWTYLGYEGVVTGMHSARALRRLRVDRLAPSHGPVSGDADEALAALEHNLERLWRVESVGFSDIWDVPGRPLEPTIEEIGPHLLTVRAPVAHFHVLRDGTDALFFDYGFARWEHMGAGMRFVEHTLDELREGYGIERIDVVVPTHYHDDHVAGIPYLQARFGTEVWAFEAFAHLLERPSAYRLPCLYPEPLRITRIVRDGDEIVWRGHRFVGHHNPGHTRYAALYLGEVDGLRVAVTGDQFERDRDRRLRGSAPVYRNHILPGDYAAVIAKLRAFAPDLMLTGHMGADRPSAADFDDCERWAEQLEEAWRELAPDPDAVGFVLDPDVVSFVPYESEAAPGDDLDVEVEVRNHFAHTAEATISVALPDAWVSEPRTADLSLDAHDAGRVSFVIRTPSGAKPRRHVIAADVVLNGVRLGEAAEALVRVVTGG